MTPTPGGDGFYVESVRHARTRLNIWEVHSPTVRDKCLSTTRALCFVVDCTEDAVGIGQGRCTLGFACGITLFLIRSYLKAISHALYCSLFITSYHNHISPLVNSPVDYFCSLFCEHILCYFCINSHLAEVANRYKYLLTNKLNATLVLIVHKHTIRVHMI